MTTKPSDSSEAKDSTKGAANPHTSFQNRVWPWLLECFGIAIAVERTERNHRFVEEALELAQSCGCSASEAHQLVDYVYSRPTGQKGQEAGGVMVTLAALCLSHGLDMHECGEVELARVWTKIETIRAKQAAKPRHSPLPEATPATPGQQTADWLICPFCREDDFDARGLKHHLLHHCATFGYTPIIPRP